MAAIARILVWYFAASGIRSVYSRSRLAFIEKEMESLNDAGLRTGVSCLGEVDP
jgi:hypothetical protein